MNGTQKKVVLVGVAVIALMLLFPPWQYIELREGDNLKRSAGYGFVFSPPSVKDHEAIREAFSIPKTRVIDRGVTASNMSIGPTPHPTPTPEVVPVEIDESGYEVSLDLARLAVQCAVAAVLVFGLYVLFGHKPKE